MSLINLSSAWLAYSDYPLLENAELSIEANERICLVGRNGAGKSTLLKVLDKSIQLDDGQLVYAQNLIVSRLQQDPPKDISGTIYDFVANGVKEQTEQLKEYYHLLHQAELQTNAQLINRLTALQENMESQDVWSIDNRIRTLLEKLALPAEANLESLSGGWLRKVALAQALACEPDVLLLDEPTNHLDIETITWLETFLKSLKASLIFISHDRSFIRNMATRIIDLDRGKLVSWPGDYDKYIQGKEDALRVEELQNAKFDIQLAQEEAWIRQGIKARRTRNEGRVRALKAMRTEHSARRQQQGVAKMQVNEAIRSGKLVFELENLHYQIGNNILIKNFSAQVLRGDKIAFIGPNGIGKSTLIKLLLGELLPTSGVVKIGTKLEIAYFDQHRATLDLEKSVLDNLADGRQTIEVNGSSRSALGYLQDFLFHPKRAMTPVRALSGGERNRLLLARLFLKPSNLLIMDEPTNDLDIETLELLEERVNEYNGTVLLVSHDRQFVDNCMTDCWIFEGEGIIGSYVGGYSDSYQQWQAVKASKENKKTLTPAISPSSNKNKKLVTEKKLQSKKKQNKLSYHLLRELEELPQRIEILEINIKELQQQISEPAFFSQPHESSQVILDLLTAKEKELEELMMRWEALEEQNNGNE